MRGYSLDLIYSLCLNTSRNSKIRLWGVGLLETKTRQFLGFYELVLTLYPYFPSPWMLKWYYMPIRPDRDYFIFSFVDLSHSIFLQSIVQKIKILVFPDFFFESVGIKNRWKTDNFRGGVFWGGTVAGGGGHPAFANF